jgi:exodeoxyribonuclease X
MTVMRVIDFETTGFPPGAGIVEVAFTDVVQINGNWMLGPTKAWLTNPGISINYEAMAVHHITEEMIEGKPHPRELLATLDRGAHYIVAHNAKFEQQFYSSPLPWVCTMKAAQQYITDAPSHKNQVLRYFLALDCDEERASPAHRAGPDTYVTAHLLRNLLMMGITPEKLAEALSYRKLLEECMFGKHKGKLWSMVPTDYMLYLLNNQNPDDNVRYTMEHWLKQRGVPIPGARP